MQSNAAMVRLGTQVTDDTTLKIGAFSPNYNITIVCFLIVRNGLLPVSTRG